MSSTLEQQFQTELQQLKHRQRTQLQKKAGLILLIAIVLGGLYSIHAQVPDSLPPRFAAVTPDPAVPPVPMPLSGMLTTAPQNNQVLRPLRLFLSPPTSASDSTLKNKCPGESLLKSDLSYLVKVVDWKSNQTVSTAFIRAGENVELNIPIGTYKLRFASGKTWYGEQHLFGTKTRYSEISDPATLLPLQFKLERNKNGWDFGLYRCDLGGNTKTKDLSPQDF
jgi:hypothetical protein